MNKQQQDFLERLAARIPRLFEAISQGNIKSEYIIGVRYIGARHVRLKLVAEVVDPGANPLATHSQMRPSSSGRLRAVDMSAQHGATNPETTAGERSAAGATPEAGGSGEMTESGDEMEAPDSGAGGASRRRRSRKR